MTPEEKIERLIKKIYVIPRVQTHDKTLNDALAAQEKSKNEQSANFQPNIWRIIMKNKMTKLSAAAIVLVAVILSIRFVTPAYAIEQTIEAIQKISSIHLFGRGWDGKKFELWMTVDPETAQPERYYMRHPEFGVTIVSTPEVSYQHVEMLNSVFISKGQLFSMVIRFDRILEDLVEGADEKGIRIRERKDPVTGEKLYVIDIENEFNEWRFIINGRTKLPVSMHCIRSEYLGEFARDIDKFLFDEQVPADMFEFQIPEGVNVVDLDQKKDLWNDPDYGISTEGLNKAEGAALAAEEYWQAVIDSDQERLNTICPAPFMDTEHIFPLIFGEKTPIEFIKADQPYVEHNIGLGLITPCTLKLDDGTTKEVKIVTKFREIDGKSSCIVAGPFIMPDEIK